MTRCTLTLTDAALHEFLNGPVDGPGRLVLCPAGLNRLAGRLEWLVHRTHRTAPHLPADAPRAVILPTEQRDRLAPRLDDSASFASLEAPTVVLALGVGPAAGWLAGACCFGGVVQPLDRVRVVGAGLASVDLTGPAPADPHDDSAVVTQPALPWPEEEVWSRTIGALGSAAWRRLCGLHVAVVGCGRSGSLVAAGLRRLGVRRLTLIDPDQLEPHNLGEMDAVSPADVGRPKAEALASALSASSAPRGLRAVTHSVLSLPGLVALKAADVFVCCAANGAARLATGLLATLYLRPLLDIGTGVLAGSGTRWPRAGADIRLILPGRCLLCLGGVADLTAASRELLDGPVERGGDWRHERRGSLRSRNGVAVHLGLRLLEELVVGRHTESTWLRLDADANGLPALEERQAPANTSCRMCALTADGDTGVGKSHQVLATL